MAKKQITDLSVWSSITLEGNLIAPAMIAKINRRDANEQTPGDYAVRKGLALREEIAMAFRVGQSHFDTFAKLEAPSVEATKRFMSGFLTETFGFSDLAVAARPLALIAADRVPIVIVPPSEALDRRSPTLSVDRSRSPAFALQDYLNVKDEALWGIATNGMSLRLMRDNASLTRPAFIEADLEQIFSNEDIASFAILWLLMHRSRFGAAGAPAADCALEHWRDAGSREGEVARDRLAGQVQAALKILGSGFLEANPELAAKLQLGELSLTEWFNELLRLVYRLIFLMVAEDRNLLHPPKSKVDARSLYGEGYSLRTLRAQSFRAANWDRHVDRFEGIKVIFRALALGEDRLALPSLGGLFAQDQLPSLQKATLRNRAFMEGLYRLSWLADKTGMVPVNWRAMETEELGSVYESLLQLQPQLSDNGNSLVFASEAAEQRGNQRKTTGSYYTPDSLVQVLLDTALDPVLEKIEGNADNPEAALLNLSIIDPACGSGHFLLAAARRIATRLARLRSDGTPTTGEFRHALRDVARSCIYGVDRNPMAVELTKVALWIETVDPGRPLGFFDAQIRCGDALLGVFDLKVLEAGIPDVAYKPLTGDNKDVAKFYECANRDAKAGQGRFDFTGGRSDLPTAPLSAEFSDLRNLPEDTVENVEAKAKAYRSLRKKDAFLRTRIGCNIYISAFLLPKTGEVPSGDAERTVPISKDVWFAIGQGKRGDPITEYAKAASKARSLHWPLEFPDILGRGGFDVVLGNPPWERIKLQEQEFFATRSPEIANAASKAARDKLIKILEKAPTGSLDSTLFNDFVDAKREVEAISEFVRMPDDDGGRFALTGRGDVNTYPLFAELSSKLPSEDGRIGIIVKTGIATDTTWAPFFCDLIAKKRIASLFDFENRKLLFPAVDSRERFCLLTLGSNEPSATFAFFLMSPADIHQSDRVFSLSPTQIRRLSPNTGTAPVFRTSDDALLTAKIYSHLPVLIDKSVGGRGNPWPISLRTMFHKTNASNAGHLKSAAEPDVLARPDSWLPTHEGGYGFQFDHRFGTFDGQTVRTVTAEEHASVEFEPDFELATDKDEYLRMIGNWEVSLTAPAFLGFRRVASATNERTCIATILPNQPMTYGWILLIGLSSLDQAKLAGNLNSLVFDYCLRNSLSQPSIPQGTFEQCPVCPPDFYTEPRAAFITPKVLELTYTSLSLASFARDLGYDGLPFTWDDERRAHLRAELDAFYARAYNLTRDELCYILDPADVKGPDCPSETFRVLKEKEIRQHCEYRTQRLVLAAWDRMEGDGEFAAMDM